MPRDGSGVYSLPAGNPVITNTIIASSWANTTLSDIAAQLNNVFTRDGLLGPTGPFKLMDGTVNAPGLAWNSEPGLGWFRAAAGQVAFAQGGQKIWGMSVVGNDTFGAQLAKVAGGRSVWSVGNAPGGSPNYNQLNISVEANGDFGIAGAKIGTATDRALYLTFPAGVQASADLAVVGAMRWGPSGLGSGTYLAFSSNNPVLNWSPGYAFQWTAANGHLYYMRGSGNPTTQFLQNGDFIGGRDLYTGSGTAMGLIESIANVRQLRFTSDNWKLEWNGANGGSLDYYNAGGTLLNRITGDGQIFSRASIHSGLSNEADFWGNAHYAGSGAGYQFKEAGISSNPTYCMISTGNPAWEQEYLRFAHAQGQWAGMELFTNNGSNSNMHWKISGSGAIADGIGPGGNWNCSNSGFGYSSDAVYKENIADILDPVTKFRQLRFRQFNRIGKSRLEVGLVAQENLALVPGAFFYADDEEGIPNDNTTGEVDTDNPIVALPAPAHTLMMWPDQVHFLTGAVLQKALDTIDALTARLNAAGIP